MRDWSDFSFFLISISGPRIEEATSTKKKARDGISRKFIERSEFFSRANCATRRVGKGQVALRVSPKTLGSASLSARQKELVAAIES